MNESRGYAPVSTKFVPPNLLTACLLLLVQFLLGMVINLFVVIAASHPGANVAFFSGVFPVLGWAYTREWPRIALHVTVGLFAGVMALIFPFRAIRTGQPRVMVPAIVGPLGVFTAIFSGLSFLISGNDAYSMSMATGFAVAVGSFAVGLFLART